jgi:hypothetical protein
MSTNIGGSRGADPMHSRKGSEQEDPEIPAAWELTAEGEAQLEEGLGANGERRSWKTACAARRSIERMQEQRRLKDWLSDVFAEADEDIDLDYYDPAEEDG